MSEEKIKALGKEMRTFLRFDEYRNFSSEFIEETICTSPCGVSETEKNIYNTLILKKALMLPYGGDSMLDDIIWYLGNNKFYYSIQIYEESEGHLLTLNENGIKKFQEIREEYKELFDE